MRLLLAITAFFQTLFNADFAAGVRRLQAGEPLASPAEPKSAPRQATPPPPPPPTRSEALTLLAALQRDARFIDLAMEPLGDYSDAQVGAAARDVLQDCRKTLQRLFGLQPAVEQQEGDSLEIPPGYDASQFRLTGAVSGDPPFTGKLAHPGWSAQHCELPQWSGSTTSALIVAPAEVQIG